MSLLAPNRRHGGLRAARRVTALTLVAALVATCGATMPDHGGSGWAGAGLVGGGGWPFVGVPLAPADTRGAAYLPGSSVVRLADGRIRLVPFGGETAITVAADDPRVRAAVRSEQTWLARGTVPGGAAPGDASPGRAGTYRGMAARALLDLRLLTRPNGASTASWYGQWRYVWPRDSAMHAAAFAATGHLTEARRVMRFLADVQNENGRWAARYHPDGTAVTDGRPPQLDALGWVLWAAWFLHTRDPGATRAVPRLWPMVARAADHLTRSLDAEGLPPPSPDYWERATDKEQDPRRPTLGIVAPTLAGLRSAAALAHVHGRPGDAVRWQRAARRVADAVNRQFAAFGYPRSPIRGGLRDTSVAFLAPPFGPRNPVVSAAVLEAARRQTLSNGGVLPGERWSGDPRVAWTPEMAQFALAAAASGHTSDALRRLDWLAGHRTSLGALPEKVDPRGRPAGVAPLGWTAGLVLLSLVGLERPLPSPPA
jgi:hypothetical protein